MSGMNVTVLHHDTITLEEWRMYRQTPRKFSLDGEIQLDPRSLDERREARWLNIDYTGRGGDL